MASKVQKGWHREDVKGALRKRGYTLKSVADMLDLDPSTVAQVLRGLGRSRRVQDKIAELLNVPASRIWPDRYTDEHKRVG